MRNLLSSLGDGCLRGMASLLSIAVIMFLLPWNLQAQQDIGGPYEADEHTMLLMHFNGDLTNASDSSGDGTAHGNVSFIDAENVGLDADLGQVLRLNNGSPADSAWVTVADTSALDLTGAWTIEFWVNVFTYADSSGDHRYEPRIVNKPGDPWYQANYWLYARGSGSGNQNFYTGYREDVGNGSYMEITSPPQTLVPGNWYHFAFIRDTTNNFMVQLIHQLNTSTGELERISFGTESFDPVTESPPTTNDQPLFIGNAFDGSDHRLDGYIDELHISNTVRNYSTPPVISDLESIGNQTADTDYEISTNITTLGGVSVSEATLHYRVNGGTWESVTMSEGSDGFTGTIPSQEVGDRIDYYVEATDSEGRTSTNPSDAPEGYNSFGVWESSTKTLHLSFEGGSGTPADSSQYYHIIEATNGDFTYSENAAQGEYSLDLTNDSTYLEIDSPFLSSDRSRTELWFNADTVISGRRIYVASSSTWFNTNAQIWFAGNESVKAGGYFPESNIGYVETTLDSLVHPNTWYKATYQVMSDSVMLSLHDANGELIQRAFADHGGTVPVQASLPITVGDSQVESHNFSGLVDEIKVYNYPTDTTFTAIEDENPTTLPEQISLNQNYPNPFNPTTNISYDLPSATHVNITVYDMLGREVRTLVDGRKRAGTHSVKFDAQNLSSGVYFYRLKADNVNLTKKMMLMK